MKYLFITILLLSISVAKAEVVREQCLKDLEALPEFLLENDSGAPDHLAHLGKTRFDTALSKARDEISSIESELECDVAIKSYLKAWRPTHLAIWPTHSESDGKSLKEVLSENSLAPKFKRLSADTAYWSIPSFAYEQSGAITTLLEQNTSLLADTSNWIIDVRGNGGGSDESYEPLIPYLLSGETISVSVEYLSTPANISALKEGCKRFANNDPACISAVKPLMSILSSAESGKYVQLDDEPVKYSGTNLTQVKKPNRIAVLIDEGCASSCEQFLLKAQQSFKVKLIGRRSYGALDYSNLRPYSLPSGKRELFYATSRSLRLPHQPVDLAGISPDIYLPEPVGTEGWESEIIRVQHWLEGGSLKL